MNERQATQNMKVYRFMKEYGQITQRDALRFGCYRLAARIADLKKRGVPIERTSKTVRNADGTVARIAVYTIAKEDNDAAI